MQCRETGRSTHRHLAVRHPQRSEMRTKRDLVLVILFVLHHSAHGDGTETAEQEAEEFAKGASQNGRHLGEKDVINGEEFEDKKDPKNVHGNGVETYIHQLTDEIFEGNELPKGEFADVIKDEASKFEASDKKGALTIQHGPLELGHDESVDRHTQTRQAVSRDSRWPKGVIPYSFTDIRNGEKAESAAGQAAIKKSMEFYMENTCLKFPPQTSTVHAEYNLTHSNYLRFIVPGAGGCWSYVGMLKVTGQSISCCGGFGTCLHEIGHAMGFLHEQDRGDRDLYVALHPENAKPKFYSTFDGKPNKNALTFNPYDLGSMMQYGMFYFSANGMATLTVVDKGEEFLLGNAEGVVSHYDLLSVTDYYDCTAKCPADKKALKCKNDGFVDVHCRCRCSQMFMGELCESLYKPSAEPTLWPRGSYGLPDSVSGCPGGPWATGNRTHIMEWGSGQKGGYLRPFKSSNVVDYFCMRSEPTSGSTKGWPAGSYCIYQQGDTCPEGFKSGSITMDDDNKKGDQNSESGSLPKGVYNKDTKYNYCCRSDAPYSTPIALPKDKPFHLFMHGGHCQNVAGMLSTSHYVRYDQEDTSPVSAFTNPKPKYSTWYKDVWLYYCYYKAINYNCGGSIDLTEKDPVANITSPNYPNNYDSLTECTWYVKAPKGKRIALDFPDFDVEDNSDKSCEDSVELRHNLLGQPGEKYCGHGFKRTILSNHGFILMTFRSGFTGTRKGFSSTFRIISDSEQCYNLEDRGNSYRGQVDYTVHYQKCMSWEDSKHCSVNPFATKYIHSGLTGNSYCRNPNMLLRPWCYINKYCEYDFCDVCGISQCYDYFDDCAELTGKDSNYCKTPEAFHGCHKSCNFCGQGVNSTVASCKPPVIKDKNAGIEQAKEDQTTFAIGETVKLVCKQKVDNTPVTSDIMCTTDGTYSGSQHVCGIVCPDGWTRHKDNCYKFIEQKVFYPAAQIACEAEKAHLACISDSEENEFIKTLLDGDKAWIGMNDLEKKDNWHWVDGIKRNYTNWQPDEPSGGWERCARMEKTGQWNDIYCNIHYPQYYVCKKPHKEYDSDYYCKDEDPNCFEIIGRNYKICKDNRDYSFAHCRRSCGLCPVMSCANPGMVDKTVQKTSSSYIDTGDYFEYSCDKGYELGEGTLGRTCIRGGGITGMPPVCKPEAEFEDTYGHRVIPRSETEKSEKLTVYDSKGSNIQRNGKAIRWEVYSTRRITIFGQVWRQVSNSTFVLVGQTMLNLRPKRVNVYTLKTFESFSVQDGDLLGWYTPLGKQGLPYSDCLDTYDNRTVYQMGFTNMADVQVGLKKTFPEVDKCRTYSIALTVGAGAVGDYVNIAASSRGATCRDASSEKAICGLAIDGALSPFNNAWMSNNESVGAFIEIDFDAKYPLVGARFMQRLNKAGQIQRVTMTFSDGSSQTVGLSERQGTSSMDISAAGWDAFDLTPVVSDSVKVTAETVYSIDYNGFIEVEFYAGCIVGWILHGANCYKIDDTKTKFMEAQTACESTGNSHLLSIGSAEEETYVKTILTGDAWMGYRDNEVEGTWKWTDGTNSTYTHWDKGEPNDWNGQDCAVIQTDGTWSDIDCGSSRRYVCEKPVNNVQPPTEWTYGNLVQPRSKSDGSGSVGYIYIEPSTGLTIPKSGSIKAWKMYTSVDYKVTMMVMRPRPGEPDVYSLVDQNTISLLGKVTNIINIETFDRIKVQAGDVIAWLYLPTAEPAIPYDSCDSSNVKVKYAKYPTSSALTPGGTISTKGNKGCRTYSISYIMTEEQTTFENVASLTSLASCPWATSAESVCGLALDGRLADWDGAWVPETPATGQTMTIQLADIFSIIGVRVNQRTAASAQIKTLTFDFGNGNKHQVTLMKGSGTSENDFKAQFWNVFAFEHPVESQSVNVTITDLYSTAKTTSTARAGLVEVQLFSSGCPAGWTRFTDGCYKQGPLVQFYTPSEKACQKMGAHISSVSNKAENDFLKKHANGVSIYLGYTLENDKWVAADGSNMNYTNWSAGQPNGAKNSEYCIAMGSAGTWSDQYCQWYYAKASICKKAVKTNQQLPYSVVGSAAKPREYNSGSGNIEYMFIDKSAAMTFTRSGSIQAWKIYATAAADVTMIVVRPVAGSENKFIIVDENVIRTPDAETKIISVPMFDRINVKAGDIIASYNLPGSDPVIPYSTCASDEGQTYYVGVPSDGPLRVGLEVTTTAASWRKCRTFSISAILNHELAPEVYDVALGAPCKASTATDICSLAVDGRLYAFDSAWISRGQGVDAWIELTLKDKFSVIGTRIQQRLAASSLIKDLDLTFSDGSTQQVTLAKRAGDSQTSYGSKAWNVFELKKVYTTSVKLTVKSVYGTDEVGFIEVQMISEGCVEGWTRFREACYKFHSGTGSWTTAKKDCASQDAYLSTTADAEESKFLLGLAGNVNTFIGYEKVNGAWVDVLGKNASYTNWKSGEPSGDGDCVAMYTSGQWNDQSCYHYHKAWTCQKQAGGSGKVRKVVGGLTEPRSYEAGSARLQIADRAESRFKEAGRVTAWQVYGKIDSVAVLSVWRPVANTEDQFTLVGSDTIATEKGRVTITQIPPGYQFKVQPGDVIGMQLPNGDSGIVWNSCNNKKVQMTTYEKKYHWTSPQPGQTFTIESIGSYYPCRTYSVAAVVEKDIDLPVLANVAASSMGTTCEASDNTKNCGTVIDGDIAPSSEWTVTAKPVTGNWVMLNFTASYAVQYISIMQRFGAAGQSKTITLEFSDGSSQEVVLKQRLSGSFSDPRNAFWDNFEIKKVDTTSIKFIITNVYTESQNGFVEIKVLAGCESGFVRYGNHCYKLVKEKPKYFPAQEKCVTMGANLVRVNDAAENSFLRSLAGDEKIWIGFRDNYKGKPDWVWSWEGSSQPYTYTNWAPKKPSGTGTWGYCASLDTDGLWRDHYCKWFNNYWFVCEKNAPGVNGTTRHARALSQSWIQGDVALASNDNGYDGMNNSLSSIQVKNSVLGENGNVSPSPRPGDMVQGSGESGFESRSIEESGDDSAKDIGAEARVYEDGSGSPPPRRGDIVDGSGESSLKNDIESGDAEESLKEASVNKDGGNNGMSGDLSSDERGYKSDFEGASRRINKNVDEIRHRIDGNVSPSPRPGDMVQGSGESGFESRSIEESGDDSAKDIGAEARVYEDGSGSPSPRWGDIFYGSGESSLKNDIESGDAEESLKEASVNKDGGDNGMSGDLSSDERGYKSDFESASRSINKNVDEIRHRIEGVAKKRNPVASSERDIETTHAQRIGRLAHLLKLRKKQL